MISPNLCSRNNIENVLPDLGERNPETITYHDLCARLLPAGRNPQDKESPLELLWKIDRAVEVCRRLDEKYGPVECFLDHASPFRLTIAVLLSAQTTDAQVNKVTPALFERFPTPEAMAAASPAEVAEYIHSLGFYKSKARHCVECAR